MVSNAISARFTADICPEFSRLPEVLTELQYLQPHQPVEAAMHKAAIRLAISPDVIRKLIKGSGIAPAQAIGRLTRNQLSTLTEPVELSVAMS